MKLKTSITSIALGAMLVAAGVCALVESPSAAPAPTPAPTLLINGAGATFPYPIYSKWFDEYHKLHQDLEFNYQSIGSGGGIRQVLAGTVDFGATDGPMSDQQLSQAKTKILHFPTVLGAVVPTYNVPGVSEALNFTPETLAGIFLGKITNWHDPAIAGPNPGVKLPDTDIIVVHRSDGSGTTYIFVDYLSKISDEWKTKVGKNTSVNWPVGLPSTGRWDVVARETRASPGW
jgi:phosphate transport system substrate-binding protein